MKDKSDSQTFASFGTNQEGLWFIGILVTSLSLLLSTRTLVYVEEFWLSHSKSRNFCWTQYIQAGPLTVYYDFWKLEDFIEKASVSAKIQVILFKFFQEKKLNRQITESYDSATSLNRSRDTPLEYRRLRKCFRGEHNQWRTCPPQTSAPSSEFVPFNA